MELIIVIAIVVILSATIIISLFTSIKKGRDAKRRLDLGQIKGALEMYYEDFQHYPIGNILAAPFTSLCHPDGCDTKKYLASIPLDPLTKQPYVYETNASGSYYKLYALLENSQDTSRGVNPGGYAGTSCETNQTCNYGIASPNVTLAPTTLLAQATETPGNPQIICGIDNCVGCCSDNVCLSGASDNACGTQGETCTICSINQVCIAGTCIIPTPTTAPVIPTNTPTPTINPAEMVPQQINLEPISNYKNKNMQQICNERGENWNCVAGCDYSTVTFAYWCGNCQPGWTTSDIDCYYVIPATATYGAGCCYHNPIIPPTVMPNTCDSINCPYGCCYSNHCYIGELDYRCGKASACVDCTLTGKQCISQTCQ